MTDYVAAGKFCYPEDREKRLKTVPILYQVV